MTTTFLIATRNAHKVQEIRQILSAGFNYLTLNDFPDAPAVVEDADTFNGNARKKAVALAQWVASQPTLLSSKIDPASELFYVLADDSGLEVDALNGAPGVHSARFAALDAAGKEGNSTDTANNAKLLRLLQNVPMEKRTARFRCVLALTPVRSVTSGQPVGRVPSPGANLADSPERRVPGLQAVLLQAVLLQAVSQETVLVEGVCEGRILFSAEGKGGFGYDPLFVPTGHSKSFAELGEEIKNQLSHRAQALGKLKKKLGERQLDRKI